MLRKRITALIDLSSTANVRGVSVICWRSWACEPRRKRLRKYGKTVGNGYCLPCECFCVSLRSVNRICTRENVCFSGGLEGFLKSLYPKSSQIEIIYIKTKPDLSQQNSWWRRDCVEIMPRYRWYGGDLIWSTWWLPRSCGTGSNFQILGSLLLLLLLELSIHWWIIIKKHFVDVAKISSQSHGGPGDGTVLVDISVTAGTGGTQRQFGCPSHLLHRWGPPAIQQTAT